MKPIIYFAAFIIGVLASIYSCTTAPVPKKQVEIDMQMKDRCSMVEETRKLVDRSVKLPAKGKFVLESHLATNEDVFPLGRLFPKDSTESIQAHVDRACKLYPFDDCGIVYSSKWVKQWTPPEGGKAGQGSIGDRKPTALQEMWSGNMFWAAGTRPKPGEKWLAKANGKAVVVAMGFETGPRDPAFLGGLQGEVLWALKASDSTLIELGRLLDQDIEYGPTACGGVF